MRRATTLQALNRTYRASLRPAWERFRAYAALPEVAQRRRLEGVLRRAQGTAFARDHGLAAVHNLASYQDAVPIRDYDGLAPWLDRVFAGEASVLVHEAPRVFERSTGSTRACKHLPYTPGFLREFSAATSPWLYDLLSSRSALLGGSSYWSISPAGPRPAPSPGGVPIGFQDDTEYFPTAIRHLLRTLLPVPPEVARLESLEACRYATLRYLLADRRLAFMSVWNPSFLTLLLEFGREHAERLADDVARGIMRLPGRLPGALPPPPPADRAQAIAIREAFPPSGPLALERVWPQLTLVSCWTDAMAARKLPALKTRLPSHVEVQGKGLLATEGVVSFPVFGGDGAVLAIGSHLLELQPEDDPTARPVLPHQAEPGQRYLPILSTAAGLYRYRLGDVIEVVGRYLRTPRVRFVGRVDGVSDVAGEKLSPGRVEQVVADAQVRAGIWARFALMAPNMSDPPAYVLYVEPNGEAPDAALETLRQTAEDELLEGHHYALCRRLGQLGPLRVKRVDDGAAHYERALVARGQRAGNIKPPGLHSGTFWGEVFA